MSDKGGLLGDYSTKEISQFQPLLADLDLAGVVVTADAMHARLVGLPSRQIPVMDRTRDHHGRVEVRTLKVATVAGLCFPHAVQAIQVVRRIRQAGGRTWRTSRVRRHQPNLGHDRWVVALRRRLRRLATTRGRLPVRALEASSLKVTSRT
jgi:hypothetical protein